MTNAKAVVRGVEVIGEVNTFTSPPTVSPLSIRCRRPERTRFAWPNVRNHPEHYQGAPGFLEECQAALLAAYQAGPLHAFGQRTGGEE